VGVNDEPSPGGPALIITADDYGYSPAYDRGILEAARAGALDAVGAFVTAEREGAPGSLLETGVEIGLHLDLGGDAGEPHGAGRALVLSSARGQLDRFAALYGGPPAFLDGHHHAHAAPGVAAVIGQLARELDLPVRSVSDAHRRLLSSLGVRTPDRLIGRLDEGEPAMPAEIEAVLGGAGLPGGVTEWMVHPGHRDPEAGSSYDAGRGEDLRLLLDLGDRDAWLRRGVARGDRSLLG
jgi:predicted glycoside hydrolase/deacetylase ChbG (UPF0249 family)